MHARAAAAERLPSVALYADHGSNGKETDRMLGTYSYGLQVSLPIFDGLHLESKKAEERARQRVHTLAVSRLEEIQGHLREHGYKVQCGVELEFYVLNKRGHPIRHTYALSLRSENILSLGPPAQ